MPATTDLHTLLPGVVRLAREAGRAIMDVYRSDFAVDTKDDDSPVTAADHAAHRLIAAGLRQLAPGLPLWSEEDAGREHAERRVWGDFWLVDPLDGTREFIKRNGEFTVNIALVRDHRPVLGVVHAPVPDRTWTGLVDPGSGGAAARLEADGAPVTIRVRRPAAQPVRVAGSRSHRGGSLDAFLAAIGPHEFVPMGSSLKFCLVAEGAADVYPRLGPTSEWDTAAAQAVVEAAGGHVVGLDGAPLRYNTGPGQLNPDFVAYGDASVDWLGHLAT